MHAQQSHPRLSLFRVIYAKILRWIDKESPRQILKTLLRLSMVCLFVLAVMLPQFTLGMLLAAAKWRFYRIPCF